MQQMFAEVAPGYDRANRVLSLGVDRSWRRSAVAIAGVRSGELALDVCAGTGDLTLALAAAGARAVGADFCPPMIRLACRKPARPGQPVPRFLIGDAMSLPFAAGTFDLCTVAFGIRNVADPVAALAEMARVVRPGGRIVVLEFCRPRVPVLGSAYLFYFRRILPRLGRFVAGVRNDAYDYLPASVLAFPEREQFLELMRRAGLAEPRCCLLTLGIAALYRGEVRR